MQVVGVGSLFFWPAPVLLKQGYLVVTGVVTAYMFTFVPEWTTWTLLIAMALYDLYAVLVPGGPLKVRALHLSAPCGAFCLGGWDTSFQMPALLLTSTELVTRPRSVLSLWPCPNTKAFTAGLLDQRTHGEQVLVELAIERDQDIPALIYEGRPTVWSLVAHHGTGLHRYLAGLI